MENSYQIPKRGSSTKQERDFFWHRIIEEQKASGISAPKYCQQHQIPFSAFRNRQHRLRVKEKQSVCDNNERSIANTVGESKFIQVQVADKVTDAASASKDFEYAKIKIIFKNCNVIELSLSATVEYLLAIIAQVSRTLC